MKINKEIIEKIIEKLDLNFSDRKDTRITKETLIECWSEHRKEEYLFYGYTLSRSMTRVYKILFKNYPKATTSEPWKAYILRINGYKYCSSCHNLLALNYDSSVVSSLSNSCKQCRVHSNRKYRNENRSKCNALEAKHRAAKLKRTPKWLTKDDLWVIQEAYSLAKEREKCTGIKWHVDHVLPLQGNLISGLHVPNNLQVITAYDNLSKSNKYSIGN